MAKCVGILGGMGPLATVDLFEKIVRSTPARVDQEHIRIIIDNHPQIPPRVEAILRGGESPLPQMVESVRLLTAAGADFIVIACNTAHYWYEGVQAATEIPVHNMIRNAAQAVATRYPELSGRVLLLATGATVGLGLYQNEFADTGFGILTPDAAEQEVVDGAALQVKAGHVVDNERLPELRRIIDRYHAAGVAAVIAGCTELPLLFPYLSDELIKIDATQLLADRVVELALKD